MLELKMPSTPWGTVPIWPASGLHLDGVSARNRRALDGPSRLRPTIDAQIDAQTDTEGVR